MSSAAPPKGSRRKKEADNWLFCWDDSLDKEPNTHTHTSNTHQTHTHFVSESPICHHVAFLFLSLSLFLSCAPQSAGLFCNIASLCVVLTSDGLWPRCELAGCSLPLWKDCYSDLWPLCWRSVLLLFVSLADLSFPFLFRALSCLRHFPSNIMFGVVAFTAVK